MTNDSSKPNQKKLSYEEKVRELADRVWQMWQKNLRNERERRGKKGR